MENRENISKDLFKYTGNTNTDSDDDFQDFEPAPPPKKKQQLQKQTQDKKKKRVQVSQKTIKLYPWVISTQAKWLSMDLKSTMSVMWWKCTSKTP